MTVSVSCSLLLSFLIRTTGRDRLPTLAGGAKVPGVTGGEVAAAGRLKQQELTLSRSGGWSLRSRCHQGLFFSRVPRKSPSSPGFWWWPGVLGTASLGDNIALISKPIVDGPFLCSHMTL